MPPRMIKGASSPQTARPTIPVHQALLAACRERDVPAIYTKFVAGLERTLVWEWSPPLAPPVPSERWGDWKAISGPPMF